MVQINKDQIHLSRWKRFQFNWHRGHGHRLAYLANRFKWYVYPQLRHTSRFPDHVDVELSAACDMTCPMCYTITEEFDRSVTKKLMSFDLFKKIVDECARYGCYSIRLSLRGEPFLNKHIVEMVAYAKRAGIKEVSTLTNGLRLNPAMFRELMAVGLDWITISFDGMGKTYEEIRAPAKFEEAVEKIKTYKRIKDDAGSVKPVIKIQPVWPSIKECAREFYELFEPYVDHIASNPLVDYLRKDENIEYWENFTCPVLYQRLVIGSDGKILLCSNDEMGLHPLGDANHESLYEVWHGPKMEEARAVHRRHQGVASLEPCKHCYLPRKTQRVIERMGDAYIPVDKLINRPDVVGR
ncbi:MAG: radical SAM protein [Nitrospira sp.]|nr:radical SAM protein [Nitrospira sp.]